FGRTPKVNPAGGRDHHPACWTVLFAGGPIQGGRVVGASDEIGYAPKDRPGITAEIAATVYRASGIHPATELPAPHDRPPGPRHRASRHSEPPASTRGPRGRADRGTLLNLRFRRDAIANHTVETVIYWILHRIDFTKTIISHG